MGYLIKQVFSKKKFSQKNEDIMLNYWLKEMSGYSLNEMNLSQVSLTNIVKKRPKLFEDLVSKCSFEVCKTAILKNYENVKHLALCSRLADLERLELSKLALSRNESSFQYISAVKAKTAKEALELLDKKIKLCELMEAKSLMVVLNVKI